MIFNSEEHNNSSANISPIIDKLEISSKLRKMGSNMQIKKEASDQLLPSSKQKRDDKSVQQDNTLTFIFDSDEEQLIDGQLQQYDTKSKVT